jgi:fucose permease
MLGRVRLPVLLSYAAFVLVGVNAGTTGVVLLAQMGDYGVDRATIGLTFFTGSAGFVLAGLTTGWLIHRFGTRAALATGGGAYVLASLYLATRPPFVALVLVQWVVGYGTGILESGLNAYLAALPGATTLLNRLHAFFGVGALAGPVLAAWITGFTSWTVVALVLALAYVPLTAGFLAAYSGRPLPGVVGAAPGPLGAEPGPVDPVPRPVDPVPRPVDPVPRPAAAPGQVAAAPAPASGGSLLAAALREPGVLLGAVMLAVYVGLEIGMGNWGFSYLVQDRGLSGQLAGYAVSGYWLGLTLGRFLISPLAAKAGVAPVQMIYACLAAIAAATALAWAAPDAVLASVAMVLLGFFLGPVFPTTMAATPDLAPARLAPTAIGVMNAGSVVGGSGLPWLAGVIAQGTGIWTLLPFSLTLAALQFAVWRPLAARIRVPGAMRGQQAQEAPSGG